MAEQLSLSVPPGKLIKCTLDFKGLVWEKKKVKYLI